MVSTRGHPKEFPEPDLSPSRTSPSSKSSPSKSSVGRPRKGKWAHAPSNIIIGWLLMSLPLVIWDTGYVLLRPLTMPGGNLHWPLWTPYELYGRVDYIYGALAFEEKNGFPGAQSFMNLVETVLYLYYLYILYVHGRPLGAAGQRRALAFWNQQTTVEGRQGALALLVGYSAAVMTVSKTALYWLNDYYADWRHIGHNDLQSLIFLWIIPNGAWLVVPSYMIYLLGVEVIQGLTIATRGASTSSEDKKE